MRMNQPPGKNRQPVIRAQGVTKAMNAVASKQDVIIIGGGFGGLAAAIALQNSGIREFIILEKSATLGGVWRDNIYPGCACDVPSRFYSYSFEQNWPWSARFGRQDEILDYLNHCAKKYGVTEHVQFSTAVDSLEWQAAENEWRIQCTDGRVYRASHVISAIGLFNQPAWPAISGRDDFKGESFHSSNWNHACDLAGKRVGVIGTGASAIQFVPEVAKQAGQLYVCQRSSQYVQPKDMGRYASLPREQQPWFYNTLPWRLYERYKIYKSFEGSAARRDSHELANAARDQWLKYLETAVPDAELRRKLTPQYPFGCKRMLQSNDWYPALQKAHVELIDTPVTQITETGLVLKDGRAIALDAIIYGTGFTPATFLPHLKVRGRGDKDLHEHWRDGAEAYLGIAVPDFPNFFMLYGPNTNASASIIYMLEHQANYTAQCIRESQRRNSAISVRADICNAFNAEAHEKLNRSIVASETCQSYFKLPNGKITTQWPWTMGEYHKRTKRVNFSDYAFSPRPAVANQTASERLDTADVT